MCLLQTSCIDAHSDRWTWGMRYSVWVWMTATEELMWAKKFEVIGFETDSWSKRQKHLVAMTTKQENKNRALAMTSGSDLAQELDAKERLGKNHIFVSKQRGDADNQHLFENEGDCSLEQSPCLVSGRLSYFEETPNSCLSTFIKRAQYSYQWRHATRKHETAISP